MDNEIKLKDIFVNKMKITEKVFEGNRDEFLTGKAFRFSPNDMVYLYFFVVEKFGECISESELLDGKFNTINGILECISESE